MSRADVSKLGTELLLSLDLLIVDNNDSFTLDFSSMDHADQILDLIKTVERIGLYGHAVLRNTLQHALGLLWRTD